MMKFTKILTQFHSYLTWLDVRMTVDLVLRWIDANRDQARPFFIFINCLEPHLPYYPHPDIWPESGKVEDVLKDPQMGNQAWLRYAAMQGLIPENAFQQLSILYDGEIRYLDMGISGLLHGLEERNLLDYMALILVSDHGEQIGEHDLIGHDFSLYDTLLHVPLLIRDLDQFAPGSVSNDLVQIPDLMPTILQVAEIDWTRYRPQIQGFPLQEIVKKKLKHNFAIAEYDTPNIIFSSLKKHHPSAKYRKYERSLKSIQTNRYKYIWASDGKHELYDLQNDPEEKENIIREFPDVAGHLDRQLKQWLLDHRNELMGKEESDRPSEGLKNALRGLGYIN